MNTIVQFTFHCALKHRIDEFLQVPGAELAKMNILWSIFERIDPRGELDASRDQTSDVNRTRYT
jgi:hypothetical protein